MKKHMILTISIAIILSMLLIGCSSTDGSIYAMVQRYNKFLSILPDDLKDAFDIDSKEYSDMYLAWQEESQVWIDEIIVKESSGTNMISSKFLPDTKEYAIGMLTNRFYERGNPNDLMLKVYSHTTSLGKSIAELEKSDEAFSNKLHSLKVDEAIVNFNNEETAFYYLWNYAIMLERPRRFQ